MRKQREEVGGGGFYRDGGVWVEVGVYVSRCHVGWCCPCASGRRIQWARPGARRRSGGMHAALLKDDNEAQFKWKELEVTGVAGSLNTRPRQDGGSVNVV